MSVTPIRRTDHGFNDHQIAELVKRAITPDQAAEYGVIGAQTEADLPEGAPSYWTVNGGYLPGLLFPIVSSDNTRQWQLKPDTPWIDKEGEPHKYVFAKGYTPSLNAVRLVDRPRRALLVEGTHQVIAAAVYAPADVSVYGISGCWSWQSGGTPTQDFLDLSGTDVVIFLDADAATNLLVYTAGAALRDELRFFGVDVVRFAHLPGRGKDGLDDVLAKRPESIRTQIMEKLIAAAVDKPAVKKPTDAMEKKRVKDAEREREDRRQKALDATVGPRFDVSRPKATVIGELVRLLMTSFGGSTLFDRGGALTMREGESLKIMNKDLLCDAISQIVRTGTQNPITGEWIESWPDLSTQGVVLQRYDAFPDLEQVVRSPFVRTDGTVCLRNGYDPTSASFVMMDPELVERLRVPDEPTVEDVQAAVKLLLDDWLVDFPFPERSDRAHILALILTPFVRQYADVVPLAVLDGNGPSAGKGLLADLFSRLVLGSPFEPDPLPADNEEVRKQITATMVDGHPLAIWDEAHTLEGKALAQLLTAPVWRDRRLGSTEKLRIPNRVTFAALGNNVRVEGDIARRAYRIRIRPLMDRPEDRDYRAFRHPDIKGWTDEHRAELLSAVLVLVRSWVVAGRPEGRSDMGSFERWSKTVGGILEHAGIEGFLEGTREWARQSNTSGDDWDEHLGWLARKFAGRPFRTSEAAVELSREGLDAPLPGPRHLAAPEGTAVYSKALGEFYRGKVDRRFGHLELVAATMKDGYKRWEIIRHGGEEEAPSVAFTPSDGPTAEPEEPRMNSETDKSPESAETDSYVTSEGPRSVGPVGPSGSFSPTPVRGKHSPVAAHFSRVEAGGGTEPLGTTGPTDPRNGRAPLIEALYVAHGDAGYVSRCPDCNTSEVLVDDLWFACGTCHPETVAANDR